MAQSNDAADPYAEKVEIPEDDLFFAAGSQTIVEDDQDPTPEVETEPAGDEAEVEGKDSQETEEPVPQTKDEPTSEDTPKPKVDATEDDEVPDSEKKRFQYWQSEADKAKSELQKYKKQYGEVPEEVIELAKNITNRPELLDAVEARLQGKAQPQQTPQNKSEQVKLELPERPQKPQRPDGYDHYEALNDPQSESYKYLEAKAKYDDDLQDWLVQREEYRDRLEEQQRAQQQQQLKQQQELQQTVNQLRDGYGMKDTEIKDFFETVNQEPSLDDLVKYYRVISGKVPKPADKTRTQELKTRRDKSKTSPPPPGTVGSAAKQKSAAPDDQGPFVRAG